MKIAADPRLFWFLKEGSSLDLTNPSTLEMYVQQVITRGGEKDVRTLLKVIDRKNLHQTFQRLKSFVPFEVRKFWEDFFGSH